MAAEYWYSLRLLACHPSMEVDALTTGFGVEPNFAGRRGDGVSSWSLVSETKGSRAFFTEVSELLSWLEGRREFLREMVESGGTVEVIVQLPGDRNSGDSWSVKEMARAVDLGVAVGFEVFPRITGVTDAT
jgi:hypothetical protein